METVGAVVSIVTDRLPDGELVFPAGSVCTALMEWDPAVRLSSMV